MSVDWAKVRYRMADGRTSTAYIDEQTGNGENKFNGEPLHVQWIGGEWVEMPTPEESP